MKLLEEGGYLEQPHVSAGRIPSTKGYRYYVDNLIYPNSINTAPLATIEDWLTDGSKVETPLMSESDCDKYFDTLKSKSIKMQTVYDKLLNDGLDSFKVSFRDLLSKLIK